MTRRLVLHAGTHKTATTFMQQTALQNWAELASSADVYVPSTATFDRQFPHTNLAWGVSGDKRYLAERGNLDDLAIEIGRTDASEIHLFSEDFSQCLADGAMLDTLVGFAKRVGLELWVVVVVREQTSYINSMYCQRVRMLWDRANFIDALNRERTYDRLNYELYYRQVAARDDIEFRAVPYVSLDGTNPILTVFENLEIDTSSLAVEPTRSADAANRSPSPLLIAAARTLVRLGDTDFGYRYSEKPTQRMANILERWVWHLDGEGSRFWGWDRSAQLELAEKYRPSNDAFARRHLCSAVWQEEPRLAERNELDLDNPEVVDSVMKILKYVAQDA